MTDKQRGLVRYWVFLVILLAVGIPISLSNYENAQVVILGLAVIVSFVSLFQDFSYYTGYGAERTNLGIFVEKHPILKYWLIFYCAIFLPIFIYIMYTTESDDISGALYWVSFLLLVGPERERYFSFSK